MPAETYDLNPVSHITVGAVGQPGKRTFFLQASQGETVFSLKLEKEQVHALARGIDAMFEELEGKELRPTSAHEEPPASELVFHEPIELTFVVGQMGLVFDQATDMLVLVMQQAKPEVEGEEAEEEPDPTEPQVVRFWATLGQMRALSRLAKEIVAQGRPICPLCQQPIDPEGHFCPRGNGHGKRIVQD
jgi:uncharacterized repeat protein (TIGR03847 family)